MPSLVTQKAPLVGAAASRLRIQVDRAAVRDLAAEIEWAKVSMVEPDDYPAAAERAGRSGVAGMAPVAVARVLRGYEDVKTDRGVIDFEDVLLLTAGVLEERPDVAATVRGQYRHFVVDEYQDVSGLQQRLLDLWLGDRDDLCVVGDASQTIYSFAGADPQHLLGFRRRYPQAALVQLVRDYRSTPQVVGLANRLLDRAPASARTARVELVAQRPAGPEPELLEHADDVDEAEQVATRIRALVDGGVPAREIAVLYRTNGQSEPLEQALAEQGRRLPPARRRAVLPASRGARGGAAAARRRARRRRLVLPRRGRPRRPRPGRAGRTSRPPAPARCASAGSRCRRWPRSPTTSTGPGPGCACPTWWPSSRSGPPPSTRRPSRASPSPPCTPPRAWSGTSSRSSGCPRGSCRSRSPPTRPTPWRRSAGCCTSASPARASGCCCPGRARAPPADAARGGPRGSSTAWCRAAGRQAPPAARSSRKRRASSLHTTCRGCGAALSTAVERKTGRCSTCPPDHDEQLFEALRGWRAEIAKEQKVPAYVVFTDATLEALSFAKPVDAQGLLKISGIGRTKVERYGEAVLDVVARSSS